ncbi:MAG: spore cortex biosynthesis protein YabQ [Sporolactobacillus sp.]
MTLHEQFTSLGLTVMMGLWFGCSYSVYRRIVRPEKKKGLALIADPLFWLAQAFLLFALLLPVNEGRLRFYLFLGVVLGFSIYKVFVERAFLYAFDRTVHFCVKIGLFFIKIVYQFIISPGLFLLMLAYKLCRMTVCLLVRAVFFMLVFSLKVVRAVLRLFIPDRWWLAWQQCMQRFYQRVQKRLSSAVHFLKKRPKS